MSEPERYCDGCEALCHKSKVSDEVFIHALTGEEQVWTLCDRCRPQSELEDAIRRNRERTEHMDHEDFGEEYFKGDDGGGRSE